MIDVGQYATAIGGPSVHARSECFASPNRAQTGIENVIRLSASSTPGGQRARHWIEDQLVRGAVRVEVDERDAGMREVVLERVRGRGAERRAELREQLRPGHVAVQVLLDVAADERLPLVGADERLELADYGRALEVRELRVERAFDRGPSRHRYPDWLRGERLVGVHAGGRELDSLVVDVPRRHHRIGRDLIEPRAERLVQPDVVPPRHVTTSPNQ